MANPERISEPDPLVTPKDVREQFKSTETAEDGLLTVYIVAATEYLEAWLRRAFMVRTLKLHLPSFSRFHQAHPGDLPGEIRLPFAPLASIESVDYTDEAGDPQEVSSDDYQFNVYSEPGTIRPVSPAVWPTSKADTYNAASIEYTAGYATADDVPERYKMLVRWVTSLWFRNREPLAPVDLKNVPHMLEDFIDQWKIYRVD